MSIGYALNLRLLAAFRFLLVPLVRILVRNGITFNEAYEVLKATYARVAATDLAVPGQPMSHSRISITTGLPRKEVLRALKNEERLRRALQSHAGQVVNVLQGWHNDPEFLGPYGVPRDLAFGGEGASALSFADLVARFASDMDPELVLSELIRVEAAKVAEDSGMIRVLKRTYIPEQMAPELVEIFSRGVRRYVETIDHNLAERDPDRRRFERWVFPDYGIREEDWIQFSDLVRNRLQDVIEDLETKFALFPRPQVGDRILSVGVGLYVYKDDLADDRKFQEIVESLLKGDPEGDSGTPN
ncbi:MAG: hypothetical protein EPO25_07950 [Gammaproteobacteria bacterium]|nr:MAG: hypothetical protein EPO25_07950 [Gammaproteobacteria bacterium]